ncbi:MAG: hypothetical protein ACYTDW_13125 [Planctomycetota bacterium]|jgi:hypothetical protein
MAIETTTIWQAPTNGGPWNNAANWTEGVPTGTKVAQLGGLSNGDVRGGLTGATAKRLVTTPDYAGKIGDPSGPLELTIDADEKVILKGRGEHYIEFDPGGFTVVVCDSEAEGDAGTLTGVIGRLGVKAGRWRIAPTTSLIYQVVVDGAAADVTIDPPDSTENMAPLVVIERGTLDNHRPSDAGNGYLIVQNGGSLIQRGVLVDTDRLVKGPGGVFQYLPLTAPDPAKDPQWVLDGFCDFRDAGHTVEIDKLVICQGARILGTVIEPGGYPPGGLSAVLDLREEFP